jgi:AP-4 complex subunit epsilon-1
VGYLAVSLFLHEDHEMMLLLINTLQTDLKSTNVVEVCIALTTIAKVMNASMIPAVIADVEKLLDHPREIVRKKAVLALHRFYSRDPKSISHLQDNLRKALCDSDPGVMVASLNVFFAMRTTALGLLKDLCGSFVDILKQVIERALTRDFDYHKVPAPWMQIKLLRLLALIGADDQRASESMYDVLRTCLAKAESQGSAAYAVVYECLCTITKIFPAPQLVGMAAESIGRFLKADNNNLKYLGITALVAVVQVNPAYAAEHQMVVIECLDDPDETLKRKTLELLCRMTNSANVTVITDKLVTYVQNSSDPYLRKELVPRIVQLAERFAPDNMWFLETMIALFKHAGDLVPDKTMNNMLMLIANPDSGDDAADAELRLFAFENFMQLLETNPVIPERLVHALCWVIGEYAYLGKDDYDQAAVMEMIVGLLGRKYTTDFETKGWVLSALSKLVAHNGIYPEAVRVEVLKFKSSSSVNLQRTYRSPPYPSPFSPIRLRALVNFWFSSARLSLFVFGMSDFFWHGCQLRQHTHRMTCPSIVHMRIPNRCSF